MARRLTTLALPLIAARCWDVPDSAYLAVGQELAADR
jgi:hypothetical protein